MTTFVSEVAVHIFIAYKSTTCHREIMWLTALCKISRSCTFAELLPQTATAEQLWRLWPLQTRVLTLEHVFSPVVQTGTRTSSVAAGTLSIHRHSGGVLSSRQHVGWKFGNHVDEHHDHHGWGWVFSTCGCFRPGWYPSLSFWASMSTLCSNHINFCYVVSISSCMTCAEEEWYKPQCTAYSLMVVDLE